MLLLAPVAGALAQNPSYRMNIAPTTPPTSNSFQTQGPTDVYPPGSRPIAPSLFLDRNPPTYRATITPGNTGFLVGIQFPNGGRGSCAEPVTVSSSSYQTAGVWDPSDPAPGIGSKIILTWVYNGYGQMLNDNQKTYCNGSTLDISPMTGPDPC